MPSLFWRTTAGPASARAASLVPQLHTRLFLPRAGLARGGCTGGAGSSCSGFQRAAELSPSAGLVTGNGDRVRCVEVDQGHPHAVLSISWLCTLNPKCPADIPQTLHAQQAQRVPHQRKLRSSRCSCCARSSGVAAAGLKFEGLKAQNPKPIALMSRASWPPLCAWQGVVLRGVGRALRTRGSGGRPGAAAARGPAAWRLPGLNLRV